jgi:hypothetical protein
MESSLLMSRSAVADTGKTSITQNPYVRERVYVIEIK